MAQYGSPYGPQYNWAPPANVQPRRGLNWLRALIIGLVLFAVATIIMFLTQNLNLYPTVILIGNFLIPIVFVVFLYDHQHISALKLDSVAIAFCIGGVLGVLGASVLESILLPTSTNPDQGLGFGSALLVGLIEEGCKILVVVFFARRMQHTSAMDGLLLGGAVGMGFAALESTGYAFTTLLLNQNHILTSISTTVLRGLLAPFGHGTWTAILGAVLFNQSSRNNRFRITIPLIGAYLFVSLLHALWDGLPNTIYLIIPPGIPISLTIIVLSIIGLIALIILYTRAARSHIQAIYSPDPNQHHA